MPSFKALYESDHHVWFSLYVVEADIFNQLFLLIHKQEVGSDVSVGLLRRTEAHPHQVHFLWDDGDGHILGRVFWLWVKR